MSSFNAPLREVETQIEPPYSVIPVISPVRLFMGFSGSLIRAESTPMKMEGEKQTRLIMLSSIIETPPPICPSQSLPRLSSQMLYTSGSKAVRSGEVFKVQAIKAGEAATGTKPDEFVGILYDCINLGGAQPLLGAILFKIECLTG